MKDKEFDAKLIAYLLGKEELFDEVVDGLAEKIKKELDETEDDETDDWDEYYKQEDYDYNHERGEENYDDEEEN